MIHGSDNKIQTGSYLLIVAAKSRMSSNVMDKSLEGDLSIHISDMIGKWGLNMNQHWKRVTPFFLQPSVWNSLD